MGEWLLAEEQQVYLAAERGGERGDEAEPVRRPGQGRWPEDRTSLPRPGIIFVGQNRSDHESALPKSLACPHI